MDIEAWQKAHERLDAHKREQALRQKQCAPAKREKNEQAKHLEQLAALWERVKEVREIKSKCFKWLHVSCCAMKKRCERKVGVCVFVNE